MKMQLASMDLSKVRVVFFDMDGVLSVGKEHPRYLGGRKLIANIKTQGRRAYVLTNDSTHTRQELHQNLSLMGLDFREDEIFTSSYLTGTYLSERFGSTTIFLVGEEGLRRELENAGHQFSDDAAKVVVVGLDRNLNYEKLNRAVSCLRNGASLVGSYGGAVYMSDHGPALSAGPIIKALEYGSGKRATMIGKPSPLMFQLALRRANEKPPRSVMVGDQIETDLLGARRAGVRTVLVLTGVETRDSIKRSRLKPDFVVNRVDDLTRYF
jgi:HAD superfamily hydrolase (TIGR01450 family)